MQKHNPDRRRFFRNILTLGAGAVVGGIEQVTAQDNAGAGPPRRLGDPKVPLEVVLLGTGSPGIEPDEPRGGTCEVVYAFGEPLLFDMGHLGLQHLIEAGLHPLDIRHLFFTHTFHYDHYCDFGAFVQVRALPRTPTVRPNSGSRQATPRRTPQPGGPGDPAPGGPGNARGRGGGRGGGWRGGGPLFVYGPADTEERINLTLRGVYAEDNRAQGLVRRSAVKVNVADEGMVYETDRVKVTSTHVKHGPHGLGYRIDAGGKSIAISGDIAEPGQGGVRGIVGFPCQSIEDLARDADLFIIDACPRHSPPKEIAAAIERTQPKKVLLTHVQNRAIAAGYRDEVKKVYRGEVVIAENLMRVAV